MVTRFFSSWCALALLLMGPGLAAAANFSGVWDTTWDSGSASTRLELVQKGNDVSGAYTYMNGLVEGVVEAKKLRGTWKQKKNGAWGDFVFVMSPDGRSFEGKWRNGNKGNWEGSWNGVRVD